jgi:hypothetical protein
MSDIRYVCLSDLHLGAENSLLTRLVTAPDNEAYPRADSSEPSEVMVQLANCLRAVISRNQGPQKPTLVLNGDALELALADFNEAIMVFERFMELTMKPGQELFDRTIYYNPGNHDHHIWETARETQYVEKYLSGTSWGTVLDSPWHTTNMILGEYDPVPCYLLDRVLARRNPSYAVGTEPQFLVVYPNLGVRSPDGQRGVIFSHGHYLESIYRLMTTLRSMLFPERDEPAMIWDLEAENFAWVDFFWSTLGRSGSCGADVELIYDKLQSSGQLRKLASNLAEGIVAGQHLPWIEQMVERRVLTSILGLIIGQVASREVKDTGGPLSADARAGLTSFLEQFLLRQIQTDNHNVIPAQVTFIFGHTHKPFEEAGAYTGYDSKVRLFNSGGWVVDSVQPNPTHGGAIVLVDDDLNAASIRLYNESADDARPPALPQVSDTLNNPLVERLKPLISDTDPWAAFSKAVFAQVPLQRQNLAWKISE